MTTDAPAATGTGLSGKARGGFGARLGGFATDLVLLALFLVVGVAFLDVLVKVVVLIVGFATRPPEEMVRRGLVVWEENRHRNDFIALGISVVVAVVTAVIFRFGLKARRWLLSRMIDASFESYVSKRYLLSRDGGSLVSLITVVSILGVSVGVMALVVVISVMNGFDNTLVQRMMGVFAHVQVWPYTTGTSDFTEEEYLRVIETAESLPEVVAAAPLLQRETFFQLSTGAGEEKKGAMVRGLDIERERQVTTLADDIVAGTGEPGPNEVVLGSQMARKLAAVPGDTLYALGKTITTARGPTPKIMPLRVVGIFQTGLHDIDENFAYTDVDTLQRMFREEGRYSSVHIRVEDPEKAPEVREKLRDILPNQYYVRTWQEINPEFFKALWVEKVAMFIILSLIVLVASLNIIGTLVMVVTQKTREIGIIKSMGASDMMVLRIFFFHGLFIGIVGTSLGTAWGLRLCEFVAKDIDKIFQLPPAVYGLDRLPVIVEPGVIALLALTSLVICIVASIIPAVKAARLNPVEALRYD